jgi:hypothetical protein
MSYLVESDTDGTRGTSDDTAIPIDEWVSADEFVIFLDFFYRGSVPLHYVQLFRSAYHRLKHPPQGDPSR